MWESEATEYRSKEVERERGGSERNGERGRERKKYRQSKKLKDETESVKDT